MKQRLIPLALVLSLAVACRIPDLKPFSDATARIIDAEVLRILHESHEEAKRLLREHRRALDELVRALLERETLGEQEILEVTGLPPAPELPQQPLRAVS